MDFKNEQKIRQKFYFSEIIACELVALNGLY